MRSTNDRKTGAEKAASSKPTWAKESDLPITRSRTSELRGVEQPATKYHERSSKPVDKVRKPSQKDGGTLIQDQITNIIRRQRQVEEREIAKKKADEEIAKDVAKRGGGAVLQDQLANLMRRAFHRSQEGRANKKAGDDRAERPLKKMPPTRMDHPVHCELQEEFARERVGMSQLQGRVTAIFEKQKDFYEKEIQELIHVATSYEDINIRLERDLEKCHCSSAVKETQVPKRDPSEPPPAEETDPPSERARVLLPSDNNLLAAEYSKLYVKFCELRKFGDMVHENVIVPASLMSETEIEAEENQMRGLPVDKGKMEEAQRCVIDGWRKIEKIYGDVAEGKTPWTSPGEPAE